jgi:hypothetical protein
MITRARLMLECPECRESKLIGVTIMDDVVGPFMCEACVVQTMLSRRLAAETHTSVGEPRTQLGLAKPAEAA